MYAVNFLIGTVGDPPEIQRQAGKVTEVRLRLYTRRGRDTEWHDLVFADKVAQLLALRLTREELKVGSALAVVGANHTSSYNRRIGTVNVKISTTVVRVERFVLDASPVSLADLPSPS